MLTPASCCLELTLCKGWSVLILYKGHLFISLIKVAIRQHEVKMIYCTPSSLCPFSVISLCVQKEKTASWDFHGSHLFYFALNETLLILISTVYRQESSDVMVWTHVFRTLLSVCFSVSYNSSSSVEYHGSDSFSLKSALANNQTSVCVLKLTNTHIYTHKGSLKWCFGDADKQLWFTSFFSISGNTKVPDCSRLTHVPYAVVQKQSNGRQLGRSAVRHRLTARLLGDHQAMEQTAVIYFSFILLWMEQRRQSRWPLVSPRATEPIVPELRWKREAAGSVRTHGALTIGNHTLAQKPTCTVSHPPLLSGLHLFPGAHIDWPLKEISRRSCGLFGLAEYLFILTHLPWVTLSETRSFISPHFYNCKHFRMFGMSWTACTAYNNNIAAAADMSTWSWSGCWVLKLWVNHFVISACEL